ncbi:hypothetical protein BKA83DRAFT_2358966 [Pisolithus microcarpus]|nr:hypothetical protein BKA83DRAFT_2358966 [Pisolithus microcarpus]
MPLLSASFPGRGVLSLFHGVWTAGTSCFEIAHRALAQDQHRDTVALRSSSALSHRSLVSSVISHPHLFGTYSIAKHATVMAYSALISIPGSGPTYFGIARG